MLDDAAVAEAAVERALAAMTTRVPDLRPATVVELFGEYVLVHVDGSPDGATVPAQIISDPPAVDGRVMVLFVPPMGAFVVGAYSGDRRLLGRAVQTSDQTGISSETDLTDLLVEFDVTQPNRLIVVRCHVYATSATADRSIYLRVYDEDGNLVGRPARMPFVASGAEVVANGYCEVGTEADPVDVGPHAYQLTATLTGGSGTLDVLASGTAQAASLSVWDGGPITA